MSFVEDYTSLSHVVGEQQTAKKQMMKWSARWHELERMRRALVRKIDRATQRLLRVTVPTENGAVSLDVAAEVVHEVEARMNSQRVMERIIEMRFLTQNSQSTGDGTPWEQLKEATIKRRVREEFGEWPILVNTGKLRDQAVLAVMGTFRMNYEEIEWPDISELTTNVPYAAAQQFGFSPNNLPARPYFNKPTRAEMDEVYKEAMRMYHEIMRRKAGGVEVQAGGFY